MSGITFFAVSDSPLSPLYGIPLAPTKRNSQFLFVFGELQEQVKIPHLLVSAVTGVVE